MKILFATDGSEHSRLALEQALEFAQATHAEVVVLVASNIVSLGAYGPLVYGGADSGIEVPSKDEAEAILKEATERFQAGWVPVRTMRRFGPASDVILTVAEEEQVDLIVMGSHGRTGVQRFLVGSVSSQVMSHAPCSVLIVKAPHHAAPATPDHQAAVSRI